jgi:hypothetical protein
MSREAMIRRGWPAAMAGGALYALAFGVSYLIYGLLAEQAKGTFFGQHAFIHMLDTVMFVLLALGAVAVYVRQKDRLGMLGKACFFLTFMGFGLGVVGGATIIVVGLAVSDEATLGVLDVIAHPLSHLLYAVGSLVFGIATFRAGVLPRGAALLAAVGPIWLLAMFVGGFGNGQSFLLLSVPVAVTALGWMWLGYALFSETRNPSAEPAPAVR